MRGGEQRTSDHPDFPSTVFGYVAFRKDSSKHLYSTPFEPDWFQLASRVERTLRKGYDRAAPTFLVAKFELVTVEAIDSRDRDER